MSQRTQPTVSKQVLLIRLQPHRAHNNTTTMQYETKTHKIHISLRTVKWAQCDKTKSRVKNKKF